MYMRACLVDFLCSLEAFSNSMYGKWQMDQQWLRSSYTYLASMVLIVCWIVSQPHIRTIISGGWKRIIQHQREGRDAGNETDTLYVCVGEGMETKSEVHYQFYLRSSPVSLDLLFLSIGSLSYIFCRNAFDNASVSLKLQPTVWIHMRTHWKQCILVFKFNCYCTWVFIIKILPLKYIYVVQWLEGRSSYLQITL